MKKKAIFVELAKVKRILIGASYYKLVIVDENEIYRITGKELYGQIHELKNRLLISTELESAAPVAQTVIHEIYHGVLDMLGYKDLSRDEKHVDSVATGLLATLFHSPGLLEFLVAARDLNERGK